MLHDIVIGIEPKATVYAKLTCCCHYDVLSFLFFPLADLLPDIFIVAK